MRHKLALAACVATVALSCGARADEPWRSQLEVGSFDVFHKANSESFDLQLRPGWRLWNFGVFAGAMATTHQAVMGYAGFTYDLHVTDHWLILPDVSVGYYDHGDDKRLGSRAEFRSGIGVAYEFDNAWRLGASIHHISNAGLTKLNPGVEIAAVTLAVPLFGPPHSESETETAAAAAPPAPPPAAPQAKSFLVFFDFNKSDLTADGVRIVRSAADASKTANVTRIDVTGHTDTVGSDAYNMRLSRRRAVSVEHELVRDGVPENEIAIFAKGKREPLVPTGDGVKEPQNRRVEIVFE